MPTRAAFSLLVSAVTLGTGAGSLAGPGDDTELSSAIALWSSRRFPNNEFALTYVCNCPPTTLRIRVSGDRVAQVRDLSAATTIELEASYDQYRGFPVSVVVDYDRQVVDDEGGFEVTELIRLP